MLTIAVLGLGNRGLHYAKLSKERGGVVFTALCDLSQAKLDNAVKALEPKEARLFTDETAFFEAGKMADLLYICTQDRDHFRQAMKGLELGYHILMEKPVSPDPADCIAIARKAEEAGRRVFVCHVLRYSAYYRRIKEVLNSGELGDIMLIRHNEHVGYWHFAHSYVRGNWRREDETTPMLMAKCCHDMDLLYWWLGKCESASSLGGLSYFTPENAPEGAAAYCKDCPHASTCPYYSLACYLPLNGNPPLFPWGTYAVTPSSDPEDIREAALNGPYGRCVFHSDNNVCDHQSAQLLFGEGEKKTPVLFSVSAFSNKCFRDTHIFGTKGELWGNDDDETLTLHLFGHEPETLSLHLAKQGLYGGGHAGGDSGLIGDVLAYMEKHMEEGAQESALPDDSLTWLTPIQETVESHLIVQACEDSRKQNGACIPVHRK